MTKLKLLQKIFAFWFLLLFAPVILHINELSLIQLRQQTLIYICHQKLDRFLSIDGFYPLVCARDIGIYLSLFVLTFIKLPKIGHWAILFLLPTLIDKSLQWFFGIETGNIVRSISGLFLGAGIMFYLQAYLLQAQRPQSPDASY